MRKFIAAGIGSLTLAASVATMAFTAAPAHATPVIPGVCDSLTGMISSATVAKATADTGADQAHVTFSNKDEALNIALGDYVNSAISYLNALDNLTGSAVTLAKAALDAATSTVGTKAAEWSTARVAVYGAENAQFAANWNFNALNQLNGGICA